MKNGKEIKNLIKLIQQVNKEAKKSIKLIKMLSLDINTKEKIKSINYEI